MDTPFYPGRRLSFEGNLCTVRYIGPVAGTKGQWLGVEWDDPTRGKHSGEHDGKRYFACANPHPTAASFIRPTRPSDPAQTFLDALRHKYAPDTDAGPPNNDSIVKADGSHAQPRAAASTPDTIRISGKDVEEVGFDKVRRQLADLRALRIVLLDGLCIARGSDRSTRAGVDDGVRQTCPKVVELDLSRNVFEEWRDVVGICVELDRLGFLRVDGNRFRDLSLADEEKPSSALAFRSLRSLSVNYTLLSWEQVSHIAKDFPGLTSLSASNNAFSFLPSQPLSTSLTTVTLEENDFQAFSDLGSLSLLPNLQTLSLKNNRIRAIIRDSPEPTAAPAEADPIKPRFSSALTTLDLSRNAIAAWAVIDALSEIFPGLTSLRISHNPLYQDLTAANGKPLSQDDGFMLTIARLGDLQVLNFSQIKPKDRLNAETYYLSQIGLELSQHPPSAHQSILARHPRYAALAALYGAPTISSPVDAAKATSLAARLLTITFHLSEQVQNARTLAQQQQQQQQSAQSDALIPPTPPISAETTASFVAEVPKAWSVYSVLGLVGKKLRLSPLALRLVWETGEWDYAEDTGGREGWDWWDSEDEDEDEGEVEMDTADGLPRGKPVGHRLTGRKVPREIEIVAGTRPIMTWVDGDEACVRVEMK